MSGHFKELATAVTYIPVTWRMLLDKPGIQLRDHVREVRFATKVGQICPKWDKSWTL